MKIASWNINSLRKRQERLLEWLAKQQPDVVCLQQTKCSDGQFPELGFSAGGYSTLFHGEKSYHGVAVLSQPPAPRREAALCRPGRDPQAPIIPAKIRDIRVFCVYA